MSESETVNGIKLDHEGMTAMLVLIKLIQKKLRVKHPS